MTGLKAGCCNAKPELRKFHKVPGALFKPFQGTNLEVRDTTCRNSQKQYE
jgi:hypothetical protein